MRTTVSIDDHLLARAREIALQTERTLGAVVDDALGLLVERVDRAAEVRASGGFRLPEAVDGSGLQPGVDLEDKDAVAELLDMSDDDYEARRTRAAG